MVLLSIASAADVSITDVRLWSTPDYARVVIHLDGRLPFSYDRTSSPERIFVDVKGASLKLSGEREKKSEGGLLDGVRIGWNAPAVPRIVLDLKTLGAYSYKVFSLASPHRIVIDVQAVSSNKSRPSSVSASATASTSEPGGQPATAQSSAKTRASLPSGLAEATGGVAKAGRIPPSDVPVFTKDDLSLAERFRRGLGVIVVDPGHGGKDPGAIGRHGVREKHVVLDISKRLAIILRRKLKAKVYLTRTRDVFIPLEERTAFANSRKADLFISVHANSSTSQRLHGIETFHLSEATDKRALEVAARENGVAVQELSDLQIILTDLRMRGQINQSIPLAENVQAALISNLSRRYSRVRDLGVKQAPFYVLMGAQMPSVLVEVGFVSNQVGAKRLKSPTYRRNIAASMSRGIEKFIERTQLARQVE